MDKKEKLSDILGPFVMDKPIEKVTAEEYVVIKLQQLENELNRNVTLLSEERKNNCFLSKKNDLLVKIVNLIFKNFEFEFKHYILLVSAGQVEVDEPELVSTIKGFITLYKQAEEDKSE